MAPMIDIAIVGAGAAGLMAAIFAGREDGLRVEVFETAARIGAKILISGGGRCNVTHHEVRAADFNGSSRNAIAKVLREMTVQETIAFFEEMDVPLKREPTGKLFPKSDRARSVVDALVTAASSAGARLRTGERVLSIERDGDGFRIVSSKSEILARRVILASGGQSVPKTGSDGAGYEMARALGHSIRPTFPALVPLLLPSGHWLTALKGVSADVELIVASGSGRVLRRESGSMLMTHFGLSGPVVLDISRHWLAARVEDPTIALHAQFLPGRDFESVERELHDLSREHTRREVGTAVAQWLPPRLAESIVEHGGKLSPSTPLGRLSRQSRRTLAHALTLLPLPVTDQRGWDFAEVTAGGVPLAEIHLDRMESRFAPGLFLCGEICDVDGRIGGFNFQWAWASGKLAGKGAASGARQ